MDEWLAVVPLGTLWAPAVFPPAPRPAALPPAAPPRLAPPALAVEPLDAPPFAVGPLLPLAVGPLLALAVGPLDAVLAPAPREAPALAPPGLEAVAGLAGAAFGAALAGADLAGADGFEPPKAAVLPDPSNVARTIIAKPYVQFV